MCESADNRGGMNSNEKSFYCHSLIVVRFSVRLCSIYAVYKKKSNPIYIGKTLLFGEWWQFWKKKKQIGYLVRGE